MTRWIRRLMLKHAPTPEKAAASMLIDARMQLFTAEQRVIDANIQLEYWRARVVFLEDVQARGVQSSASVPTNVPAMPAKAAAEAAPARANGPRLATGM
ncbi:hypothetical protein [Paraburkholderia flava]|uniref:hypothetical protein n=1 Tax=Paraburkholderia flava TaxID=2547393 RepID=UPI00105D3D88|nr:hypothetical protein [Paraburkholderia flava]